MFPLSSDAPIKSSTPCTEELAIAFSSNPFKSVSIYFARYSTPCQKVVTFLASATAPFLPKEETISVIKAYASYKFWNSTTNVPYSFDDSTELFPNSVFVTLISNTCVDKISVLSFQMEICACKCPILANASVVIRNSHLPSLAFVITPSFQISPLSSGFAIKIFTSCPVKSNGTPLLNNETSR